MCFKKKKKEPIIINSKYHIGENVRFRNRFGDFVYGVVSNIKQNKDGKILYDVQVGGECPYVKTDIPEEEVLQNSLTTLNVVF